MTYDKKNCFSRLPCGLCRLTNTMCPFAEGSNYEVTFGTSPTNAIDKFKVDYSLTGVQTNGNFGYQPTDRYEVPPKPPTSGSNIEKTKKSDN